jgi:hypothetical protein
MSDPNEIGALKAAFRGVSSTTAALQAISDKIGSDISPEDLEELARVTLAHAVASQALRGLVDTMRARRGAA